MGISGNDESNRQSVLQKIFKKAMYIVFFRLILQDFRKNYSFSP